MFKLPTPDDRDPAARDKYYFGVALALGMILSTTVFFLLEVLDVTDFLRNWP